MIQYTEMDVKNLPLRTFTEISYKVEYNMMTTKFWAGIRVTVGFVSSLALLIWAFRIYTWRNRNRIPSTLSIQAGTDQIFFIIHLLMIGFHTIVLTFVPFLFCLCTFW